MLIRNVFSALYRGVRERLGFGNGIGNGGGNERPFEHVAGADRHGKTKAMKKREPVSVAHTRQERMVEWCHGLNVRRYWVVPDKSPRSIYLAAHRRAKV